MQSTTACRGVWSHLLPLLLDDSLSSVPLRRLLLSLDASIQRVSMMGQAVHDSARHLTCVVAAGHERIHRLCHAC